MATSYKKTNRVKVDSDPSNDYGDGYSAGKRYFMKKLRELRRWLKATK